MNEGDGSRDRTRICSGACRVPFGVIAPPLPVHCSPHRGSLLPIVRVRGYSTGTLIERRRCSVLTSQYSMVLSAVPKMIEVPSGPMTRLLVGRAAAGRDRRWPVSGFQSCTSLPNPAKITHPFVETAMVSTYAGCGGETAIRRFVPPDPTRIRDESWTPSESALRARHQNVIGRKVEISRLAVSGATSRPERASQSLGQWPALAISCPSGVKTATP